MYKIVCFLFYLLTFISRLALSPNYVPGPDPPTDRADVIITAYSSTVDQTDGTPFITASGTTVRDGTLAVSRDLKSQLDFGQVVYLDGIGYFIVEDVMHSRWTNRVDIWFPSRFEAIQFGVRQGTLRWDNKTIKLMGVE